VLEALSNVVAIWQLRRSVSGGQVHASGLVTRFFRFWWSYRVEIAAFWGTYWFLFVLTMVLGSHLGGWVLDVLVLLLVFCRPVRRRVRAVFSRSRLRRRFARAVRSTGCPGFSDAVPRPGPIKATRAGQLMRVRLCAGWDLEQLVKRAAAIAAYLGVREVRIMPDRTNAGVAEVAVIRRDPLSGGKPLPWPWLDKVMTSLWDPIPVGVGEDGDGVEVSMSERNMVVGGEPGGGKSVALSMLVAAAALDRYAQLTLFDGKLVELSMWRGCADSFVGPDLEKALEVLKELRSDMEERYRYLMDSGRRKITREDGDRFPLHLVAIDELASFTLGVGDDKKLCAEFSNLLRDLVSRGRAAGIIVVGATQKPASDVVPTALRDLFGFRWALRSSTPQASDTILGSGWATQGFTASSIDAKDRGVGFLLSEGGMPVRLKAYYLSDEDLKILVKRAEQLRGVGEERAS
jgi:FtsK/SpoIIIE family